MVSTQKIKIAKKLSAELTKTHSFCLLFSVILPPGYEHITNYID